MIILNNSSVADIKYGSQQVDKVYHGSNLVWQREEWDGEHVYLRVGNIERGYGDILLGGSDGLLYNTGSSNPNYDGLTSIETKYGFTIKTSAKYMHSNYSLLNLFDGKNSGSNSSYAYVSKNDASSRQFNFEVHMPFNQWQLTRIGYWEGTFSDSTDFVNQIYLVPPNRTDNVTVYKEPPSPTGDTLHSITRTDLFDENGDPNKNRFIIKLASVGGKTWHFYTEIIFQLKIPYTEYKTWKRQYHVPVKIAEKTINNKTIGSIVMK